MFAKKLILAALTGSALLAAAPAFADNGRGDRNQHRGSHFQNHRGDHFQGHRGNHFQHRPVFAHRPAYGHYWHRPVVVQRPGYGYYGHPSHNVLGGLILGTVIGAAIANHNNY